MERRTNHNVSRRDFLAGALATAAGLPLLNACAPAAPSGPAPAGGAPSGGQAKTLFPTYDTIQNGPKAEFHDTNPLYTDAFDNFQRNPTKSNQGEPRTGSTVIILE